MFGPLLLITFGTVQAIHRIGSWPLNLEKSRPPTLDPYGDGSVTGPGSPWRPAPKLSQKSVSGVAYPRKAIVNLDLPPRQRWKDLIIQYRDELIPHWDETVEILNHHTEIDKNAWAKAIQANMPSEYVEELRGIFEIGNNPKVKWEHKLIFEALYEVGSPMACSQLLMATKDGTVLHGRNLDYKLFAPIVEVTFMRKGKPLYIVPHFAGAVGFPTIIKPGYWAFGQDTRIVDDDTPENTLKRLLNGATIFGPYLRSLADLNLEYDDVVAKLREVVLVRSMYFVLSGAGPFQGTVITRWWDPSFRHTEDLTSTGKWYAVQTNDDNFAPPKDDRRPTALHTMAALNQSVVSPETMINIMHNPPLFVKSNVYLFVMSVKAGKFCSILGPLTKNDDTSIDCGIGLKGWHDTLPKDVSAWSRYTQ